MSAGDIDMYDEDLLEGAEEVDVRPWRHGTLRTYKVDIDGVPHLVQATVHHSEGIDTIIDLGEAVQMTITHKVWRLKPREAK